MYETFDIGQLIPLIDQRFRTYGTRAERAVIGESMGGYGVMTLTTRHPDLFATAVSMSGALDSDSLPLMSLISASSTAQEAGQAQQVAAPDGVYGPRATQEIRWHGHNPPTLRTTCATSSCRSGRSTARRTHCSRTTTTSVVGCSEENEIHRDSVSFHDRLVAADIPHLWKDYGAGCHGIPEFGASSPIAARHRERLRAPQPRRRRSATSRSSRGSRSGDGTSSPIRPGRSSSCTWTTPGATPDARRLGHDHRDDAAFFRHDDAVDVVTSDGTRSSRRTATGA